MSIEINYRLRKALGKDHPVALFFGSMAWVLIMGIGVLKRVFYGTIFGECLAYIYVGIAFGLIGLSIFRYASKWLQEAF